MIKHFCDLCGKETTSFFHLELYIHLLDKDPGYVDQNWNKVSGRTKSFELCPSCYNEIMQPVADQLTSQTTSLNKEPI